MGIIKGQNLRVMVDGKCVAMATSCQFHVSAQMEDSSTKDSTGDWQEQEVVGLSWDAQTDSLVTLTDNGTNGELPQNLLRQQERTTAPGRTLPSSAAVTPI